MAYQVKISNFEGPFDLLFHLIEEAKVDIYDIPIAEITNQYLEYISQMDTFDLDNASEFIVMAATLLHIKSRMLLPKETSALDEITADMEDPRAELVEKLIEYKKYKEISEVLRVMEEENLGTLYKNAEIIDDVDESEILLNITLDDIVAAFNDVVKRFAEVKAVDERLEQQLMEEEFTVDDKIDDIRSLIKDKKRARFNDLFIRAVSKLEIIMTFLALLELIRLKEVTAFQDRNYGEIIIQGI